MTFLVHVKASEYVLQSYENSSNSILSINTRFIDLGLII